MSSYNFIVSTVAILIMIWTKTILTASHVNSWSKSLRTTICSGEPDSYLWISKMKTLGS